MQYDAEFCDAAPTRLKGIAMINVDDVEIGAKELEHCANLGFVGAMVTVYPPIGRRYDSPEYKPLRAAVTMTMGTATVTTRPTSRRRPCSPGPSSWPRSR